jgi:hypothetical protein
MVGPKRPRGLIANGMSCMFALSRKRPNRRSGQNGPQNGPKIGHFGRYSLEGSNGPSVSVGTSKLS